MTAKLLFPTRREVIATVAMAGAVSLFPSALRKSSAAVAIRPFSVDIAEADLADLRSRVAATRWPDKETVGDTTQGVQLATMQKLAKHWATDYDWRKVESI